MIGKQTNVTLFNKKESINFIKTKCNAKVYYLINKFKGIS